MSGSGSRNSTESEFFTIRSCLIMVTKPHKELEVHLTEASLLNCSPPIGPTLFRTENPPFELRSPTVQASEAVHVLVWDIEVKYCTMIVLGTFCEP